MIRCGAYGPGRDSTLPRLSGGLLLSLAFHLGLALCLATMPATRPAARFADVQSLQVTLKDVPPPPHPTGRRTENRAPSAPAAPATAPSAAEDFPMALPALPLLADQTYVAPDEVEEMASVVDVAELPLPQDEQTPGGALYLKISISETGGADRIDILTSTLPEDYAATLVNAFYQAKFNPARTAGLPVKSWRVIEIRFGDAEPTSG